MMDNYHDDEDFDQDEFDSEIEAFAQELLDSIPEIPQGASDLRIKKIEMLMDELGKEGYDCFFFLHLYDPITKEVISMDVQVGNPSALRGALHRTLPEIL